MQKRSAYLSIYIPAIICCLLLFSACENDLNKVRAIAAADATKPIQVTKGVTVIFSDTAVVKAQLTTPLYIEYQTKNPYSVMPKGLKIIFYDNKRQEEGNIVADSGINYASKKLILFRKNVVATRFDGAQYKSDELYYDQNTKQLYSNKYVVMTKPNGDQTTGTSFKSDDRLLNPVFQNSTAIIHVAGESLQQ